MNFGFHEFLSIFFCLAGVTLVHVSKYIQEAKKKHVNELEVQMKYNEANDRGIARQTEKVGNIFRI